MVISEKWTDKERMAVAFSLAMKARSKAKTQEQYNLADELVWVLGMQSTTLEVNRQRILESVDEQIVDTFLGQFSEHEE